LEFGYFSAYRSRLQWVSFPIHSVLPRHTMFANEIFRLMLWLFLIIFFDQTNLKNEEILA